MNTANTFADTTIVAFHIGRGGRFHNAGHLSFCGQNEIGHFVDMLFLNYDVYDVVKKMEAEIEDWDSGDTNYSDKIVMTKKDVFFSFLNDENFEEIEKMFGVTRNEIGEKEYYDGGGSPVGLTEKECESGVGSINIDNDYDTTYTCFLKDIDEREARAILEYPGYVDSNITNYAKELLGIEDETEG